MPDRFHPSGSCQGCPSDYKTGTFPLLFGSYSCLNVKNTLTDRHAARFPAVTQIIIRHGKACRRRLAPFKQEEREGKHRLLRAAATASSGSACACSGADIRERRDRCESGKFKSTSQRVSLGQQSLKTANGLAPVARRGERYVLVRPSMRRRWPVLIQALQPSGPALARSALPGGSRSQE